MAPSLVETSVISSSSSDFEKPLPHDTYGTVVVEHHRSITRLLRYWVHLAAIGVTALISSLNFLNLSLMVSESSNKSVVLNLFQFVAKAHELLILGSLSLLLLDSVRSRLVSNRGVPLGYVLSPTLFNDLGWLTSRHFWSCLKANNQSLSLVLLMMTAIPFANLSGPLSAITVVPRIGWSSPKPAALSTLFFQGSAQEIWPTNIAASSLGPFCTGDAANGTTFCPAGVLQNVFIVNDSEENIGLSCTWLGPAVTCNSTMSPSYLTVHRPLSLEFNTESLSIFTSTPTAMVYEDVAARFQLGLPVVNVGVPDALIIDAIGEFVLNAKLVGTEKSMLKPVVNTTCQQLSYSTIFDMTKQNLIPSDWSSPTVSWLGDADGGSTPSFVYTFLKNDTTFAAARSCAGQDCYVAIACSIDAKLVPTGLWINTAQQTTLFQSNPHPGSIMQSRHAATLKQIVLRKGWLDQFTSLDNITSFGQQVLPQVLNRWSAPIEGQPITTRNEISRIKPSNFTQGVAAFLGSVITEGISQYPTSSNLAGQANVYTGNCSDVEIPTFVFPPEVCAQRPTHWIHAKTLGALGNEVSMINLIAQRNVYGWFIDSITVKLSLAVLLLHALLTLLYLIHTFIFRKTITRCWDTAPEMLVLALNSLRAPALMGSSTRIKDSSLWREPVTVRQLSGDDDLSLIVGDPRYYGGLAGNLPEVGRKYD